VAPLSNTAADLVRSAENQLEFDIIRPQNYPAAKFPVWALPWLLSHHTHPDIITNSLKVSLMPSTRVPPVGALCEPGSCLQKQYCMWNVYIGLKMYLVFSKQRRLSKLTAITRDSFHGSDDIHRETWDTLYSAQILNWAIYI
jgi:hypothetical protein